LKMKKKKTVKCDVVFRQMNHRKKKKSAQVTIRDGEKRRFLTRPEEFKLQRYAQFNSKDPERMGYGKEKENACAKKGRGIVKRTLKPKRGRGGCQSGERRTFRRKEKN